MTVTGFDLPPVAATPTIAYPLTLTFKLLGLSHQFELIDANGKCIAYVKQPWMKLKEAVTVYTDSGMSTALYTINADRIIDISAKYNIATAHGTALGQLQRHGLKSFVKAHYELHIAGTKAYTLQETNPWVKVLDNLLGQIPIIGFLTAYFFHPRYALSDLGRQEVLEVKKVPSFFERKFKINALTPMAAGQENTGVLACLMMILLESHRG
jgi:uncharacterized protein YxjI